MARRLLAQGCPPDAEVTTTAPIGVPALIGTLGAIAALPAPLHTDIEGPGVSKLKFAELALRHGLRHPDMGEPADAPRRAARRR